MIKILTIIDIGNIYKLAFHLATFIKKKNPLLFLQERSVNHGAYLLNKSDSWDYVFLPRITNKEHFIIH